MMRGCGRAEQTLYTVYDVLELSASALPHFFAVIRFLVSSLPRHFNVSSSSVTGLSLSCPDSVTRYVSPQKNVFLPSGVATVG